MYTILILPEGPVRVHAPKHTFLYPSSTHARKPHPSMYAAGLPTHHVVGQTQGGDVLKRRD